MAKSFEKLLCLVCNYSITADKKGNYTCPCCGMSYKSKILKDKRFALISEMIDKRMSGDFDRSAILSSQLSQLNKDYSVIAKWNSYLCSVKVVLNTNGYFISDRMPKGTKPNVDNLRFQEFCQDAFKNDRDFCGSASVIQLKIKEYFDNKTDEEDFANPSIDILPNESDFEINKNNSVTLSDSIFPVENDDDDIIDDDDYVLEEISNDGSVVQGVTEDNSLVIDEESLNDEIVIVEQIDSEDNILEEVDNEQIEIFDDIIDVNESMAESSADPSNISDTLDADNIDILNASNEAEVLDDLDISTDNTISNDELNVELIDANEIDDINITNSFDNSISNDELDITEFDTEDTNADSTDPLIAARELIESEILEDRKAGVEVIKYQAKLSVADAMFLYGYCWEKGICVVKNCKNALSWYKKALASGIPCSEDVSRMEKEVIDKLTKQQSSPKAKNSANLDEGVRYYNRKDYDNAFAIFKRATEAKNKNAYFYYAICLEYGLGCEISPLESFKYYSQAVKAGDDNAVYYLAQCYLRGFGCEANSSLAYKYFKKSADNGNAKAEYRISLCYKQGIGVEINMRSAFKWALSAARKGVLDAINDVAWYYVSGTGTKKDYDNAFKWFKEGALLGDANAMYNLAICYEQGFGIDADIEEALKWYRKSSRLGSIESKKRLKQIKK